MKSLMQQMIFDYNKPFSKKIIVENVFKNVFLNKKKPLQNKNFPWTDETIR